MESRLTAGDLADMGLIDSYGIDFWEGAFISNWHTVGISLRETVEKQIM